MNENPDLHIGRWHWPDLWLLLGLFAASLALTWVFHALHLGWMGDTRLERAVHLAGFVTVLAGWPVVFCHYFVPYVRHVVRPGLMKPVTWWRAALATGIVIAVPFMPAYWFIDPAELRRFPTDVLVIGNLAGAIFAMCMGGLSTAAVIGVLKYRARLWLA